MTLMVGKRVQAQRRITEDVDGQVVVHAEVGDTGEVVDVEPVNQYPTVQFDRTLGVTICHPDELKDPVYLN